ncbi:RecA-superfamily ATPase possibly involved in signal transduction [Nostoc sp. PCC 7524]|uniref:circadian clock protein KaiC n=1 Tax=Nostoc sp. (strain ATCC 29411 / PCC 7524) TaxID=28072 RepID=UPI00029F31DD|nr:circadian clock protein KaiC [Nostoc sp. PCC 7524]AFY48470.1 RecA-superfamily ATPase possibly involved in signal transduction [Nostoc sp. PCC 7524]
MNKAKNDTHIKTTMLAKCPTGIQGLDEITFGGLPQGRPVLLCGKAGCGKTLIAMEFLVRGATEFNEPGVFLAFEETAEELAQNVASLGWDLAELINEKKLAIDHVRVERSEIEETGEYDLEALFIRLGFEIDAIAAKRVVIDTLEVLFGGLENAAIVRSELRRLFLWLKSKGVTAIITSESGKNSLTRHGLEEYVSDCVIRLDQRITNELSTRWLQIIKYRGSRHGSNEYPFLIKENGISVLPITSVSLDYPVTTEWISSGIKRLDTMLGGKGFFRGSSILISGTAGTGKSSLCAHFADATCQRGEKCLFFAFEESAQQIIRNMRSIGINLENAVNQGLLKFQNLRPTFYGLEMHLVNILSTVNEFQPDAVIFDPISNLTYGSNDVQVKSFMTRLIDYLKTKNITTLFTNLNEGNSAFVEYTEIGISSLADTWILLRTVESNGERNRLIHVLKSRGTSHSNQVREFLLTNEGVQLLDVYLGAEGVLTGTARIIQEAKDKAVALVRQNKIEQKQRDIERKRLLMEAQIKAIESQFEIDKQEIERLIAIEENQESFFISEEQKRARLRQADSNYSGNI